MLYDVALRLKEVGHTIVLVVTAKEAPEYLRTADDFKLLADENHAKFIYTPQINQDLIVEEIKKIEPVDIAVSINYTGIINDEVISLFRLGVLNLHAGDLPKYRGNAIVAWAMLNKEKHVASCIHKMIGGELDSGDIIEREYYSLTIQTKIGEVFNWLTESAPDMFVRALEKLTINSEYCIEKQSKDPKKALRCYPRLPEDSKINWNESAENIVRLINASSEPFSGAFCEFEGEKMIVWCSEIQAFEENYFAMNGQVSSINFNDGSITVITGNGKIKILEIEYEGLRTFPAAIIKSIRKRLK